MRRWIAENRLRAETLVQAEGSLDWKPLNSVPELAGELKSAPPTITPPCRDPPPISNPRLPAKFPPASAALFWEPSASINLFLATPAPDLVMLLVSVLSCFTLAPAMHIIGIIEGVLYLTKTDDDFVRTYVDGRKEWF